MHVLWKKRPDFAAHIEKVVLNQCNGHPGVYLKKWVVCDIITMTFTAAVVTSACVAPVYMVLLNVL